MGGADLRIKPHPNVFPLKLIPLLHRMRTFAVFFNRLKLEDVNDLICAGGNRFVCREWCFRLDEDTHGAVVDGLPSSFWQLVVGLIIDSIFLAYSSPVPDYIHEIECRDDQGRSNSKEMPWDCGCKSVRQMAFDEVACTVAAIAPISPLRKNVL
jgi:hypothetical protein